MTDDLRTMVTGQPAPEYPERCRGCGNVPLVVDQNGLHRCREIARLEVMRWAIEAATDLVRQMRFVHNSPEWKGVWSIFMVHGGHYNGPRYDLHLDSLDGILARLRELEGQEEKV